MRTTRQAKPTKTQVKVPEKVVLAPVLQYLRLKQCLCYRMNTGAGMFQNSQGPKRFVRFGKKGMADILAFTPHNTVLWVECKATNGKQSENQKQFQKDVEKYGHIYILAHSLDEVMDLYEGGKDDRRGEEGVGGDR